MSRILKYAEELVGSEFPDLTGTDKDLQITRVSGWYKSNIGTLNNLLFATFNPDAPNIKDEEASILGKMYMQNYYKGQAGSVIKNMSDLTISWLTLQEGDSKIQLQNKNEVAKTLRQMASDYNAEIAELVERYNRYQAMPRQVTVIYSQESEIKAIMDASQSDDQEFAYNLFGTVDVPVGQAYVQVTFEDIGTPDSITVTLIKPDINSANITYSVRQDSISNTGFIVDFGAIVSDSGYKLSYVVYFAY
jgi:hypothetical protein